MNWFSGKKDDPKKDEAKAPVRSIDDGAAAALPQKAKYFNAVRTDAYENTNPVSSYIEFWAALRVEKDQEKWRVMHYMIFDMDKADGKFQSEVAAGDCSFSEAIWHMAKFDSMGSAARTRAPFVMTEENYPVDAYPDMKVYFFDIEHYHPAANIEGIAFDEAGHPYRRVEGKVVSSSTFKRSEVIAGFIETEESAKLKIEGGVLSDIFNASSGSGMSLDDVLKIGQTLSHLDAFAAQIGAFYLGVQKTLGLSDGFDKIQGLSEEDKKAAYNAARKLADTGASFDVISQESNSHLKKAEKLGAHIEPFQKFITECEIYSHLLAASLLMKKMKDRLSEPGVSIDKALTDIRSSTEAAEKKFLELGGSTDQMDRLKAWIVNPKKDPVPAWLPGFLSRYYAQRSKVMDRVQRKDAVSLRDAVTLAAKVKPAVPPSAPQGI